MKYVVIYTRFSTDMQRKDSCDDQERTVRRDLARFGVPTDRILVIRDEAQSGTKSGREGFQRLSEMIKRGEVEVLAVDDQSRLTRADNASAFIQDLVFACGRFISTSEGIDTDRKGWELGVKAIEMKNSATIRNLSDLVRRGQEGRVLADGSAGDFPVGYESYYLDTDWAEQLMRRGPKPKKGLRVFEDEAKWVRDVFMWFTDGRSITWIAKELTRLGVAKGHRATTAGWHHQQVRRMLANSKYVGKWAWGATTTIRNSQGRKKQAPTENQIVRYRPDLRIVEDVVWERAQRRLAELVVQFGMKEGHKKRGPRAQPADVYPRSLLGGLLVCGACGAKMHYQGSAGRRFYACSGKKKGLCSVAAQVPAVEAERALTDFLTDLLGKGSEWLSDIYARAWEMIREESEKAPERHAQDGKALAEVRRQIDNLVSALADGRRESPAARGRLGALEDEEELLRTRMEADAGLRRAESDLPSVDQLREQMCDWAADLGEDTPKAAAVLRQALGPVSAHAVLAPGKKRGYAQLRFRVRAWSALRAMMGNRLPENLLPAPDSGVADRDLSPEIVLDLGTPTEMDRWAAQIAAWRTEGVIWEEIVRRTGLDLNRAFIAWKRFTGAQTDEAG
jgi:site-specific DNA recombinase